MKREMPDYFWQKVMLQIPTVTLENDSLVAIPLMQNFTGQILVLDITFLKWSQSQMVKSNMESNLYKDI